MVRKEISMKPKSTVSGQVLSGQTTFFGPSNQVTDSFIQTSLLAVFDYHTKRIDQKEALRNNSFVKLLLWRNSFRSKILRQLDSNHSPLPFSTTQMNCSAMIENYFLRQRKPYTGTAALGGEIGKKHLT